MDANTDMNFDVLKDEVQLYMLGVINKEELLEIINDMREGYGCKAPLEEIPEQLDKLMKSSIKMLDMAIIQLEDMFSDG